MPRYHAPEGLPTLDVALFEYMTVDDLRSIGALTGEALPTRKTDLVGLIKRHLTGDGLRTTFGRLDELQRAAVAEVVHTTAGQFDAIRFEAKYGRQPNWGDMDRYGHCRTPSVLALFFYRRHRMPDDLRAELGSFVPPPIEIRIETVADLPATCPAGRDESPTPLVVHTTERRAQRELLSILRLIDAGRITASDKTHRPTAAAIEQVAHVLESGDWYPKLPVPKQKWEDENAGPIRSFAWPMLVQAGGLAELAGTRLQLTRTGRKALADPPGEVLRMLWSRWIKTTLLDELSRVDCIKGQTGKGKHKLIAVASRRRGVANALSTCPVGAWMSTKAFLAYMRASGADLRVTRDAFDLYIAHLEYGNLGNSGGEEVMNDRYVLAVLLEYAATLGLVDVALLPPAGARPDYSHLWGTDDLPYFSRYDGLMYVRISPLGAWCLGIAPDWQPQQEEIRPMLRVAPELVVEALESPLDHGDQLALDAWAVRTSEHTWQLDADRLLATVDERRSIAEIERFLTARSAGPLPEPVSRLLQSVAKRCTQLRDAGLARLIECADAPLAALIAGDPRTRRHCLRAGEHHLVVPPGSEAAFRRGLRELGYLIAASDAKVAWREA